MGKKVLWFTGLSGSGKTTIANELSDNLIKLNKKVKIIDGDQIRNSLHKNLSFHPKDIELNNKKIALMCKDLIQNFDFLLVPIISPFRRSRKLASKIIGDYFFEIFINASLNEVQKRDVKGLYKKALNGEIDNFIGIDDAVPYEKPIKPDLILFTEKESVSESVNKLLNLCIMEKT